MVREEDAYALVTDVMMLRAARGHDVTVTPERIVWLVRLGALMIDAFGLGRETEEDDG